MKDKLVRDDHYLYYIAPDPFYYYTGTTTSGFQVLAVLYYPSVIMLVFDQDGNFIRASEVSLSQTTRYSVEQHGFYDGFLQRGAQEIESHLQGQGLIKGRIRVKRFFLPEYNIGIRDFPESFTQTLQDPLHYSAEELEIAQAELKRWAADGLFELWLNADSNRWIDLSGRIQSS